MQYRTLGRSGLQVSPICLGTMTFGEPVAQPEAVRLVHEAVDLGINFIDTANMYEGYRRELGSAGGVAEEILGHALKGKRDRVVVATKVGAPIGPGPQDRGLSPAHILREVENCLRRLQTDYIDLFIMHWPDRLTPLEATLDAMDQAVRHGKVRHVGVSNHSAAQLCEMLWIADRRGFSPVVSSQIPMSLLRREFENDLSFCESHDIAVTPYQPLQGGLLTSKYKRGASAPADSRAAEKPGWMWPMDDALFDKFDVLDALADEAGTTPARYALAWAFTRPAIASLVVGVKRSEQIVDAVEATKVSVPDSHHDRIDAAFPPPWKQPDPVRG